ncbi:hypothetical protein AMK17_07945 [Streptomyces sp. CB00072]|uniref:DUF6284 family protein n=1 Tax=Streptomyces sp. CB00072 TaxID=1703928 RepID=UPI00093A03EE|nr:DUF6284 family protein [Streptomyces sp. CB00072]OKI59799.1 hypothetical protein AMK17_07945 [Streptomyces sp. CB00072]
MKTIAALHAAVTAAAAFDGEPSNAELDAIDRELPVILADVVLLDAEIMTIDRMPTELDERRIRRARRRVLAARRDLANLTAAATDATVSGGAA